MKGFKKAKNIKKICRFCKKEFFAADIKAEICDICKKERIICSKCGGKKIVGSELCIKCSSKRLKNMNKKEIIKKYPNWKNCGFQEGEKNVAKRPEVGKKISDGVTNSYIKNPQLKILRSIQIKNLLQTQSLYDDGLGNKLKSKLELNIAQYLQQNNIVYEYEKQIADFGRNYYPDFFIDNDILIEVCGWILDNEGLERYLLRVRYFLEYTKYQIIILTYKEYVRDFKELKKIRPFDVVCLTENNLSLKQLFIEKITNIDYTHTLPFHTKKCKNIHSHSSYDIGITLEGYENKISGMMLDYGIIKDIVKKVVDKYDHKIIIGKKYVSKENNKNYQFDYKTLEGHYFLDIPKTNIVLVENEATLETISSKILNELDKKFPINIINFSLIMREGTGGGCISSICRENKNYYIKDLSRIINFHKKIKITE